MQRPSQSHSVLTNGGQQFSKILSVIIPAKLLHNRDIVSVHFNHFYCTEICDKLNRYIDMLTCIYLKVDDC